MSTRDRRQARADRLREWAAKREIKAEAAEIAAHEAAEHIPFGQPILIGHHSEGRARRDAERIRRGFDRAAENAQKAREMSARAENVEEQLAESIYSDDDDAIPRLEAKIADLEAERDRIKAYNKTARAGSPDLTLLTEQEKRALLSSIRFGQTRGAAFPGYHLSNINGRLSKARARLAALAP